MADPPVCNPGLHFGGCPAFGTCIDIIYVHCLAGIFPIGIMYTVPLFAVRPPASIFHLDKRTVRLPAGGTYRSRCNFHFQNLFSVDVQTRALARLPDRFDRIDGLPVGKPLHRPGLRHSAIPAGISLSISSVQLE